MIIVIIIAALIFLLMLILLITFAIKYYQMKKKIEGGMVNTIQGRCLKDKSQSVTNDLASRPLPDNFASKEQINTLLSYVDDHSKPLVPDDFKLLGRGYFGVVYQVRLPDIDLVAAKLLPETIRTIEPSRSKRKKSTDIEANEDMITNKDEIEKKKAAIEMLMNEMKVMDSAGKHMNIVALKKVAYPEAKFKYLFTGGPIRDEDLFYLMELCSNGSLESVLKTFLQSPTDSSNRKLSLYERLEHTEQGLTIEQACEQCLLTDDDLKLIAYQVARGLDYLNRKLIVHCDIAPRNVLVTSRFIMKICDFG
jgi:serine/threonine protein kinase